MRSSTPCYADTRGGLARTLRSASGHWTCRIFYKHSEPGICSGSCSGICRTLFQTRIFTMPYTSSSKNESPMSTTGSRSSMPRGHRGFNHSSRRPHTVCHQAWTRRLGLRLRRSTPQVRPHRRGHRGILRSHHSGFRQRPQHHWAIHRYHLPTQTVSTTSWNGHFRISPDPFLLPRTLVQILPSS